MHRPRWSAHHWGHLSHVFRSLPGLPLGTRINANLHMLLISIRLASLRSSAHSPGLHPPSNAPHYLPASTASPKKNNRPQRVGFAIGSPQPKRPNVNCGSLPPLPAIRLSEKMTCTTTFAHLLYIGYTNRVCMSTPLLLTSPHFSSTILTIFSQTLHPV